MAEVGAGEVLGGEGQDLAGLVGAGVRLGEGAKDEEGRAVRRGEQVIWGEGGEHAGHDKTNWASESVYADPSCAHSR